MDNPVLEFDFALSLPTSSIIWFIVIAVVLIAGIFTIVFIYHWRAYNITRSRFGYVTIVSYLAGLTVFLGTMLVSALTYVS